MVFLHGLFGFSVLGPSNLPAFQIQYWRGVREALEELGVEVLMTASPASGSTYGSFIIRSRPQLTAANRHRNKGESYMRTDHRAVPGSRGQPYWTFNGWSRCPIPYYALATGSLYCQDPNYDSYTPQRFGFRGLPVGEVMHQ